MSQPEVVAPSAAESLPKAGARSLCVCHATASQGAVVFRLVDNVVILKSINYQKQLCLSRNSNA